MIIDKLDVSSENESLRSLCHSIGTHELFWSSDEIVKTLGKPTTKAYIARAGDSGPLIGLIYGEVCPYKAELLYLYVDPGYRNRGIGRLLVQKLMDYLKGIRQMEFLYLEVRKSNQSAIHLYSGLGFSQIGERQRYYTNGEDAYVLRYEFKKCDELISKRH